MVRFSDWSPERDALERIYHALRVLTAVSGGSNPSRIEPGPRPVSAAERLRKRNRLLAHRSLSSRLVPVR